MFADWEAVIGLEVHVQLATRSKLFSGSSTAYGAEPNTQASPVDVALPGTLPVPNREAVRFAIRLGLAIDARIAPHSVYARKNYFYPDLPKGYQISQYEDPIVSAGRLAVRRDDGSEFVVPIQRAHLEEDAGKSVHDAFHGATGIDLNRAGTPLLEIVTEPALHSASDATAYLKTLHRLVRWLGVSDGNMQEGSFRCDANVSVRRRGDAKLGTRAEIKNVNSFRFVEKAIDYEIERQVRLLESGGSVVQETRLYDETRNQTRSMRSKESAHDYRYFPDPDLPPLAVTPADLERERAALPELPAARRARYVAELALGEAEADALTAERDTADYFDVVQRATNDARLSASWVIGELAAALNEHGTSVAQARVAAPAMGELLARVKDGTITAKSAKDVFAAMWAGEGTPDAIIAAKGLKRVSDDGALLAAIAGIVDANPTQVAQYRGGDDKVYTWLVGQVMKATRGKADPARVNELLRRTLDNS